MAHIDPALRPECEVVPRRCSPASNTSDAEGSEVADPVHNDARMPTKTKAGVVKPKSRRGRKPKQMVSQWPCTSSAECPCYWGRVFDMRPFTAGVFQGQQR